MDLPLLSSQAFSGCAPDSASVDLKLKHVGLVGFSLSAAIRLLLHL